MNLQIFILLGVFFFIAFRRFGRLNIKIWQSMSAGAILSVLSGGISPVSALSAIRGEVMIFLFSMFLIGVALEESGLLHGFLQRLLNRNQTTGQLVLYILFFFGCASAILMNDTVAIIGTPLVLAMAKRQKSDIRLFLLALCFAITIGSTPSPFGNPQNLLIAIEGEMANPFVSFGRYLLLPTIINLLIAFFVLRIFYRQEFSRSVSDRVTDELSMAFNPHIKPWVLISMAILLGLILLKIGSFFFSYSWQLSLELIAALSAVPVLIAPQRWQLIKRVDWETLIFFAAMFILMQSVWDSGFFQQLLQQVPPEDLVSKPAIIIVSVLVSQLISNVPLVALYLPILQLSGIAEKGLILLAASSTIAGNLLILGAASNVIVIQNAEKRGQTSISFLEFAKVGLPLTVLNSLVYYFFMR